MTLILYKTLSALFILLVSLAVVIYPLKRQSLLKHAESVELGEALASGIFLGMAFFHMLPDAIKTFTTLYGASIYPIAEMICVGGFLLLLFLERLSIARIGKGAKHSIPNILAIILIIHALTEGAALGIGSTLSETIMLFIAIIAHKGSESYALCITMLRHQVPIKRIIFIIIMFAIMTPLGVLLGAGINQMTMATSGQLAKAIFNSFAAGTFLYISTLHHIRFHQHTEEVQGMLEFSCLVLGLVVMGALALWV